MIVAATTPRAPTRDRLSETTTTRLRSKVKRERLPGGYDSPFFSFFSTPLYPLHALDTSETALQAYVGAMTHARPSRFITRGRTRRNANSRRRG